MLTNCSNSSVFALKKNHINLKVSKSQNKFMKSSFLPKYKPNILRIFALASKKWLNQKLHYTNFQKCTVENFSQILLGDKNATSLCSKNISTLTKDLVIFSFLFFINVVTFFDCLQ